MRSLSRSVRSPPKLTYSETIPIEFPATISEGRHAVESVTTAVPGIAVAAYTRPGRTLPAGLALEENDKHKLEGLLKARSQDMRQGRRTRLRRPVSDAPAVSAGSSSGESEAVGTGRSCDDCGGDISPRRLRAMPRTTRCLPCQRVAEATE